MLRLDTGGKPSSSAVSEQAASACLDLLAALRAAGKARDAEARVSELLSALYRSRPFKPDAAALQALAAFDPSGAGAGAAAAAQQAAGPPPGTPAPPLQAPSGSGRALTSSRSMRGTLTSSPQKQRPGGGGGVGKDSPPPLPPTQQEAEEAALRGLSAAFSGVRGLERTLWRIQGFVALQQADRGETRAAHRLLSEAVARLRFLASLASVSTGDDDAALTSHHHQHHHHIAAAVGACGMGAGGSLPPHGAAAATRPSSCDTAALELESELSSLSLRLGRLDEGLRLAASAHAGLSEQCGAAHPAALAARLRLAAALAAAAPAGVEGEAARAEAAAHAAACARLCRGETEAPSSSAPPSPQKHQQQNPSPSPTPQPPPEGRLQLAQAEAAEAALGAYHAASGSAAQLQRAEFALTTAAAALRGCGFVSCRVNVILLLRRRGWLSSLTRPYLSCAFAALDAFQRLTCD